MRAKRSVYALAIGVTAPVLSAEMYLVTMSGVIDETVSGGLLVTPYFSDASIGDPFTHSFVYQWDRDAGAEITSYSIQIRDEVFSDEISAPGNQSFFVGDDPQVGRIRGTFGSILPDGAIQAEVNFQGSGDLVDVFNATGFIDPDRVDSILTIGVVHFQNGWTGDITDVTVSPIPGPGAVPLLGVALAAGTRRRRRR